MSPFSGRFTFVLDQALSDSGAFGVTRGENIRGEFGPYVRADMNKELSKNINLSSTLELFTDYLKNFIQRIILIISVDPRGIKSGCT